MLTRTVSVSTPVEPEVGLIVQARATLAQAKANLAFAESDLARASQLVRDRTITEQTFEQRTQAKRVAEASMAACSIKGAT